MRLKPGLIFSEHMVLQRNKTLYVFGESIDNDIIKVTLNKQTAICTCTDGRWVAELSPEKENEKTVLRIESETLDEKIEFSDVAIGEVILAGGQSNMEFIMKYDIDFEEMKKDEKDDFIRYFAYPQTCFKGFIEKEGLGKFGLWRRWDKEEDRKEFSAVSLYMAKVLREKLNVPVGIISANWGGTPAVTWTKREDVEANPAQKAIIDWRDKCMAELDMAKYYAASEKKIPKPTKEMERFTDYFMMGGDMREFFKNGPPPMNPDVYSAWNPGPRSCIFPGNLYENILLNIAPYAIRAFTFWQGEDDDARDWAEFYDSSMITMINSWRNLWNEEIPFFQVELSNFKGVGVTAAKKYPLIRQLQHSITTKLEKVYTVSSMDIGEEYNIHPRHKQPVGTRLGKMIMKYVFNEDIKADCPDVKSIEYSDNRIIISFVFAERLVINGDIYESLKVNDSGDYDYEVNGNRIIIECKDRINKIEYCYDNYSKTCIFNEEGNPAFGFRREF